MRNSLLILLILLAFGSCRKETTVFNSNPLLYKDYISGFTGGTVSAETSFKIAFNKALSPDKISKINNLDLFEIAPKVKGKVVSSNPYEVEFIPEKRLEQNTQYKVSFHLKKLFEVSDGLETFRFSVKTLQQGYKIKEGDLQSYNENLYFLNAELLANDKISYETAKKLISAQLGNKKVAVKFLSQGSSNRFSIVFDSLPRAEKPQNLEIKWQSGAPESTTPFSFVIPERGVFKALGVKTENTSNQSFRINFSEPLEKNQNFNGLVTLSQTSNELKYSVNGNVLNVFRETSEEGEFQVTVYEGIRSLYGKRISEAKSFSVNFLQQKPEIRLVKNGTILPSSQNLKIHFQTINLRAVNATVYRIYENNILQFLQENNLGTGHSLHRVGKPIAKKVIQLSESTLSPLKEWNTYSLDLSSVISPEPGAIYRVEFSMKKNYSLYACGSENEPLDLSFEEEPLEKELDEDDYYYYWGGSNNPCDEEYYGAHKNVATNVLGSDLGVIVKKGQNNHYTVIVNNILDTEPVSGATVEVFDYQQQKIQEGKTDGNGIAKFEISHRAFFAKVRKDNSTTYVKMDDGVPQSLSNYDVDGLRLQKGLNGHIYAERGVWRPGDSIYVGFVLNDFAQKTPENLPIKLKFTDPYGKVMAERVQSSNPTHHYVFGLKTSPEAPTGNWNVSISAGAAKFSKQIKVETIKPNRLKIENSLSGKLISAQGENARLQVLWLHGSPAGNTKVNVKAKFYPMETAFKGYEKYLFNNKAYQFENQEISVYEGQTDSQGNTNFYFKAEELQAPGMLRVNFLTQADESGGDFSTDVTTASFSPYDSYVGLRLPETNKYDYYDTEKNHTFQTVVLSEKGKPLSGKNIQVSVYKVGWNWWWDASNQNISTYSSSSSNALYTTKNIETDQSGKAKFDIKIPDGDWGRYFILLSEEDSGHKCGTTVYFDWGDWSGKSRNASGDEAVMLAIGSNKKEYNVGEKAKISFPSDKGGRALISVENGSDVIETHWVTADSGETTYEIPITERMTPNVYFYVTLLQPHAHSANDAPIRLYGVLPISVVDKQTRLEPVIQMAETLRPEQKTTIKISEKNGKTMTYSLAIVEDGLLNLTRFKTPNPWSKFFSKTALGVKTWDVYNDIIGAYGGTVNQAFSIGGDEDLGGADAQKANRFKPFVIVKGPFELKKGNTNAHTVQIPNYMGSARVMVIASDVAKNAFGSAEKKDIPVISPLSLLGSLPRKAVPGEKITLPVTVFAMEKNIRNATVSVETNAHFKVVGNKSQSLQFSGTGEKMAYFELETTQQTGIGKVKITATSGNEKATYEVEMDIYNPNPVTYFVQNAVLAAGESQSLNTSVFGEKAKTVLEISSFPGVNLHQRLNYLISYPHGCGEQITSGAFPQLFLGDFVKLTSEKSEEVRRNVTAAISKLHENQLPNGGFAYWKGNRYADDWATSYIGHFFISAEKKGYVLPSGSKQNWLNYQNNEARQWRFEPQSRNDFAQAYRLYTLALAGEPNMGAMNRLRETGEISSDAKRLLAASYAVAGQKQTAINLFQSTTLDGSNHGYYYGSEVRNKAMALETALLVGKKEDAARWALEIADKLSSSDWMSTQTTAYALYAMAKYVEINKSGASFSVSYSFAGKTETVTSSEPMASVALPTQGDKQPVQLKNTSKQTLYVRLISSGVLPVGEELTMQNGLALVTTYRDKNGNVLDERMLRQSTELTLSIEVKNLTNESVENVALTQIIPSGWEIINTRFTDYVDTEQDAHIDYADFRDDRANFYLSLRGNQTKVIRLKINASYAGRYYLPGTFAEAMYNPRYNTRTQGKWVEVIRN
ncbi:alpha-2-macroglobulin [Capnocytophaga sp.]|uniref:alpha-2-macroglobulin family protein n=1 Tax=Capnocytophaga sp. TaxID=44737 RepID=UPI0026DACB37|nr:MG2 domain-containing protein [Capnocytophaga sp.]MDO5104651.1 MG2 domain-containing protein [Capnocytophaga sp.]